MTTPVDLAVLLNLLAALQGIATASGYHNDVKAFWMDRLEDLESLSPGELAAARLPSGGLATHFAYGSISTFSASKRRPLCGANEPCTR